MTVPAQAPANDIHGLFNLEAEHALLGVLLYDNAAFDDQ